MAYLLLRHRDIPDINKLDVYVKNGGFESFKKAVTAMQPGQVMDEVKASGLRGRGGAGFPTGVKWSFIPKGVFPTYVVANADESEPGTFKDREIMEGNPYQFLEGVAIACYAIQSNAGYVYLRGEFQQLALQLDACLAEMEKAGFLGDNLFGTKYSLKIRTHLGAGAYICGEETSQLSSIEGGRGYPRLKPPFPAVEGVFRRPTVVNNVETLCNLPHIIERGADWFRSMGTEKSPGPKIFSVCGHVNRPGNYEVPLGTPLRTLLNEQAKGVRDGRRLKAVIPGGSSVPVLTADEADKVNLDFEAVAAAGSMLGSGGVIVMDDTTCMVDALYNLARFYHHESCGQCTPCREGTGWIEKILRRIEHGLGRPGDLDLCLDVARNMTGRTICVLADALAMPVQSFIPKFRQEFEAHIREQRCPFRGAPAVSSAAPGHA
jgi:NADH-quinone oxidoreductase subunit F